MGSGGPPHGAEHPTGQVKAGELGQDLQLRRIDGNICRTAGQDLRTLAVDVLRLHQEGYRRTPGVQRPANDQRTFRHEQGVGRVCPVQKLIFRQPGINIQFRGGKIGDGDDRGHGGFLLRGIV